MKYAYLLACLPLFFCACSDDSKDNQQNPPQQENTDPGKTDPTDPGKTDPTDPGKTDPTDPGKTDPTDPGKTDPADPGKTDPANPGKTDPEDPGKTDPEDPGKTDPADPGKTDPEDPGKTDPADPGKTDPEDPVTTDSTYNCGINKCTFAQACINGQCVARNSKASLENSDCQPNLFPESCDGNKAVYCSCIDGKCQVAIDDCTESSRTCAVQAVKNNVFCVKEHAECKATGTFNMCYDSEILGASSYVEVMDCALAADGKYYPFRTENMDTKDCIGPCISDSSCNIDGMQDKCDSSYKESCIGDVAYSCADGKVYMLNCADYDIGCIVKDGTANCDWAEIR